MDQQHWESEGDEDENVDLEFEGTAGTFYVALKLALARLKECSAAATG